MWKRRRGPLLPFLPRADPEINAALPRPLFSPPGTNWGKIRQSLRNKNLFS